MAAKEKKGLGTGLGILFGEEEYNDENELPDLERTQRSGLVLEPRPAVLLSCFQRLHEAG